MLRFLIVPQIAAEPGQGPPGAMLAKYFHGVVNYDYTAMTYGRDNTLLVAANLTPEQHATIASNLDVISIPLGLDSNVSLGALQQVRDALENLRIPGNWVTTEHTYRQVVGIVGRIFTLMQYFQGQYQRTFWELGITLGTRMNQLTVGQRTALQDAALHFGASSDNVTGQTTVRQVLKMFADQMPSFSLAGQSF